MSSIAKIGFFTSIISYALFAFFDYLRPGFVSNVFSVHWFLFAAGVFASVFVYLGGKQIMPAHKTLGEIGTRVGMFGTGCILFLIFWREGEVFGDLRFLLALAIFFLPWVAWRLANE